MASPLLCLVCGYENGGTTALSEVLRRDSSVDAGFEGGFLLATTPERFRGVSPHFEIALRGWGLAMSDMDFVLDAPDWDELYRRLARRFAPDRPDLRLFDKTPAYLARLGEVMDKVPGTPVVVIVRDPRGLFWSWRRRSEGIEGRWIERYATRYLRYRQGLVEARERLGDRILEVRYEDLCTAPDTTSERILSFLGLSPDRSTFDPRFPNVRGTSLTTAFLLDHRDGLSASEEERILEATGEAAEWWWEPPPGFVPDDPPESEPAAAAPEPHPKARRGLMNRAGARDAGGPDWVGNALVGPRVTPRDVVLDIGWMRLSPWEAVVESRRGGYARHLDWLRDGAASLEAAGGRYDAIVAHTVLPLLSEEGVAELLGALADHLPPGGRVYLTSFPDDSAAPEGTIPHAPGSIETIGSAFGYVLAEVVGGHPAGQVLVTLTR